MLSLQLLNKIQQGVVDALKALKTVHQKCAFSCDCILMIAEMYLQKFAQYQSEECAGVDEEGNLYKNIVVFKVVAFKLSILSSFKSFQKSNLTDSG